MQIAESEQPHRPESATARRRRSFGALPVGESPYMYGRFSGMSFSIVAGAALLVIAIALFGSPLLAVFLGLFAVIGFVIGMAVLRARSREAERELS